MSFIGLPATDEERLLLYMEAAIELAGLFEASEVSGHLALALEAWRGKLGLAPEMK